jgi:signal peptidase I
MVPTLAPGDWLFIRHLATTSSALRLGQIVVAKVAQSYQIKRIASFSDDGVELAGDNEAISTDSRNYGAVGYSDVMAVALFRVWPHPGRLK